MAIAGCFLPVFTPGVGLALPGGPAAAGRWREKNRERIRSRGYMLNSFGGLLRGRCCFLRLLFIGGNIVGAGHAACIRGAAI